MLKRLLSECEYNLDADALPEGEDFIEYFLYESKEGYSMHFAAAATMMFRMLGVPARYVVGYVAPKEVFTADENGTYTAILEDDNAHAWTEIYQPFLGWIPVEVTPGMEAETYGDLYMEEIESEREIEEVQEEDRESALTGVKNWFTGRFLVWLKKHLDIILFGGQMLLITGAAIWLLWHVWRQRRRRLGLGKKPDGQIQALYRSLYRVLVLAGMPEGCTIVLSGRGSSGDQDVFVWLAENAVWKDAKEMESNAAGIDEKEMSAKAVRINVKELDKMRQMILRSHYGVGAAEQAEAEQMLALYRKCWKILRRQIPLGKRAVYLWKG